jgi:glycosyltransferase involved in cell wall biosynthesis
VRAFVNGVQNALDRRGSASREGKVERAPPCAVVQRGRMVAVSVLVPAFQAEATLGAALRSVQRQTERDWECVVVDDGSTDGTARIVRELAGQDARIRWLSVPHVGIVAALNAGLAECRGELVARMDADDLMQRRRLERQRAALAAHADWVGVGCHVRLFPRRGMTEGLRSYECWLSSIRDATDVAREAFVECPLAHPTLMLRREVLERAHYRDTAWPEDYDLVLRLLEAGHRLGVVPERLLHWRDGAGRLSRSSPRYSIAAFVACKAEFVARGFLRNVDRYVLWGYGATGKALAAELACRGKYPAAIIELHPGRLGQLIRGVRVIPLSALPSRSREPVLVSVAGVEPRTEIRVALAAMGFRESVDFICCA